MKGIQSDWDRQMLIAWYDYPKCKVLHAVGKWERVIGLPIEVSYTRIPILRLPARVHLNMDFRFWVSNYLPRIAAVLLATDRDDVLKRADILLKLSKATLDTSEQPLRRSVNELARSSAVKNSRSAVRQFSRAFAERRSLNDSYNRSGQWGVCK